MIWGTYPAVQGRIIKYSLTNLRCLWLRERALIISTRITVTSSALSRTWKKRITRISSLMGNKTSRSNNKMGVLQRKRTLLLKLKRIRQTQLPRVLSKALR